MPAPRGCTAAPPGQPRGGGLAALAQPLCRDSVKGRIRFAAGASAVVVPGGQRTGAGHAVLSYRLLGCTVSCNSAGFWRCAWGCGLWTAARVRFGGVAALPCVTTECARERMPRCGVPMIIAMRIISFQPP